MWRRFVLGGVAVVSAVLVAATANPAPASAATYTYTFTNVNSGKCLDVAFGGKENFSPVVQYACYNGPIQQWRLTFYSAYGAYSFTNVNSGKCLDVAYGGKENFSPI